MTSNLNKQSMDDYKRNTLNYMKMSNILKYWHWMQHVYTYIKINESHCTEKKDMMQEFVDWYLMEIHKKIFNIDSHTTQWPFIGKTLKGEMEVIKCLWDFTNKSQEGKKQKDYVNEIIILILQRSKNLDSSVINFY